ncbi:uncharacterized protein LOC134271100 [Saccostrea cucullata]|uniref:uncharacterized protein LOC134271100 n=1 Tax=Saccostrea cuccullata TaxID=36930 RepID=UPI002ECFDBFF
MRDFATLTLVCCLILVSVFEHAEAQSCGQLTTCTSALTIAVNGAGQDKSKLCRAYNTNLNCLYKAVSDCGVDVSTTITNVKTYLSSYGCSISAVSSTSGCGSMMSLLSWPSLTLGVFLHKLF